MSELAKTSRAGPLAATGAVLAILYVFGMVNYWVPALRFTTPLANALSFAVLQIIPFTLFAFALAVGPRWARIMWCAALAPVAAFAALFGSCAVLQSGLIIADGADASFERIDVVPLSAGHLSIYRTNGGAMTSFGIAVRQECRLLPGLLRVRNVWDASPAYEVQTQIVSPNRVRFSSPSYGHRRPNQIVEEVELKPLWCRAAAQQGAGADRAKLQRYRSMAEFGIGTWALRPWPTSGRGG